MVLFLIIVRAFPQDPVKDLAYMKSLLKENAQIIHSTDCYKYCYAYTKYHLFFFEGKSLDVICDKVGLIYEYTDRYR